MIRADVALRRCTPPGYICLDIPQISTTEVRTNRVSVAAIVADRVPCQVIKPLIQLITFKLLCFTMTGADSLTGHIINLQI